MKDELLIKFLLNESTEAEKVEVNKWRLASEANEKYYNQFQAIWEAGKALAPTSAVDENAAWNRFKAKADQVPPVTGAVVRPIRTKFAWMRIAAVFVLVIGSWGVYSIVNGRGYADLQANDQVVVKKMPDGSELTLNKNSEISYARNFKNHRSIRLKSGDVFFDVAKDKTRPFIIEADNVSVEVVGTTFNVKHLKGVTEVNVESGIVKVRLKGQQIALQKGERVMIRPGTISLQKESVTDRLYNYYRSREFVAVNTPLWRMVSSLNEAYGSNIQLDPKVRDLLLNTTLRFGSLEENLDIICATFPGLRQSRHGKDILLSYQQ